jgi:hypothetical protein
MKYLLSLVIIFSVYSMASELAATQHAPERTPVQYNAPSDGDYVHGEHCMDSRVF